MEKSDSAAAPQTQRAQDFGKSEYGCDHYQRRCKIRAQCCDQIFTCRHSARFGSLSNPNDRHELVRQDVKQVVCSICNTEQQVGQLCSCCGVNMGEYFCDICKFYDDDTNKGQFHCNECGICRVGGRDNFFHCQKCATHSILYSGFGSCYGVELRDNHLCVENSMKNHCPVCYEYLFDSIKGTSIMNCGHTMHTECFIEMHTKNQYRCPVCSKSFINMTRVWNTLDVEEPSCTEAAPCSFSLTSQTLGISQIAATPMREEYQYEVAILCVTTCSVAFHILGLKCTNCSSYNTRRISGGDQQ